MGNIDVFVSHATVDDLIVSRIHNTLESAGLNVWVDHEDGINPGDNWSQEIQDAVNICHAGLFVMSNASVQSQYCISEWQRILSRGNVLYIVLIEAVPLEAIPLRLGIIQYVDLRSEFDKGMQQLINAIKGKFRPDEQSSTTGTTLAITGSFPRSHLDISLVGRDGDLASIQSALRDDNRMISILGLGGMGKTRLAVEVAVKSDFRNGVIWHTISPHTDIGTLTTLIRDHLQCDETLDDNTIWQMLAQKEILIVLDNAEDCRQPLAYAQRINQLEISAGTRFFMTSRHQWREVRNRAFTLNLLDEESAVEVLRAMLKQEQPVFPANDYMMSLVRAARYHPRLIQYSVSWLNSYPPNYVLEILEKLEGSDAEEVLNNIVRRTIEQVQLSENGGNTLHALRQLTVFRDGFTFEAAGHLIDDVRALAILKQWSLIELTEGRYSVDPLVIKVVGTDTSAHTVHFEYYKQLADKHDDTQDYEGLDVESSNLEAAFEWGLRQNVRQAFWLYNSLNQFFPNRGRIRETLRWGLQLIQALKGHPDKDLQAGSHNLLGMAYRRVAVYVGEERRDNLRRAIAAYESALEYRTPETDPHGYAQTQNNLGIIYFELSYDEDQEKNLHCV